MMNFYSDMESECVLKDLSEPTWACFKLLTSKREGKDDQSKRQRSRDHSIEIPGVSLDFFPYHFMPKA